MPDVGPLFDDFAVRRARGEDPDVAEYMRRAGDDAPELAVLIEALIVHTAPPDASEPDVAAMAAWLEGEAPLLAVRVAAGRRRQEVVDRLAEALGTPARLRARLAELYHRLETGLIDRRRVDRRVLDALSRMLGTRIDLLPGGPPPPGAPLMARMPPPPAPAWAPPPPAASGVDLEGVLRDVVGRAPTGADDPEARELDRMFGL